MSFDFGEIEGQLVIVHCKNHNGLETHFMMKADDFRLTMFPENYTKLHDVEYVSPVAAFIHANGYKFRWLTTKDHVTWGVFADWSAFQKVEKNS